MFGLMKLKRTNVNGETYSLYKKLTCSLCDVLGTNYGNKSRLLLNNDIIFLCFLILEINNDTDLLKTSSRTLFFKKDTKQSSSKFFKYLVSLNILLSSVLVEDNIKDSKTIKSIRYKLVKIIYKKSFSKGIGYLNELHFPLDIVNNWLIINNIRENQFSSSYLNSIEYFAEPSAVITGCAYYYTARHFSDLGLNVQFQQLGYNLGKLIYILDAYVDVHEDIKEKNFNPILSFVQNTKSTIEYGKQFALQLISKIKEEIYSEISFLPIRSSYKENFLSTLDLTISKKILPTKNLNPNLFKMSSVFSLPLLQVEGVFYVFGALCAVGICCLCCCSCMDSNGCDCTCSG
jgi:hypothetical protein